MTLSVEVRQLPEPELEFGVGTDSRVKEGLTLNGPYSLQLGGRHPAQVKVGLVGPRDAVERTSAFLRLMQGSLPSLGDQHLQRPPFPGFKSTFQSDLLVDDSWRVVIDDSVIDDALKRDPAIAFGDLLKHWSDGIDQVSNHRDPPPNLIVCAVPGEVLKHCHRVHLANAPKPPRQQLGLFDEPVTIESATGPEGLLDRDFRRALKAAAMRSGLPIQIVTPNLYGPVPGRYDDPASRAWNLAVALFYKSGGAPWRVAAPDVDTLYVGISFHHRWHVSGHTLYAGLAQAFYPGSEGFALRGGEAEKSPEDLRLRLSRAEMERLLADVLEHYRIRTSKNPRRVVVFKTTAFDDGERAGAAAALDNIPRSDFIALRTSDFRLLRQGDYPPARGMLTKIGSRGFLLTTGYQANRQTYKGSHIPVPLDLVTDCDLDVAAADVMALTKLNWNSAADHTQFPVTLAFAQKVGTIMAEVPEDQPLQTRLSFYI